MNNNNTSQAEAEWTYPTRTCRICLEEVPATVTMYPPGLPVQFQTPNVEYKNSDEYGRLIRPCLCKGGMRYIHELCLMQSRVGGGRSNAKWQCPTCLYRFSFQRLNAQRILESPAANAGVTVIVLIVMMFVLGFIADPLINLYFDPYDTIRYSDYWHKIDLNEVDLESGWTSHFSKGFVTMGLVGFLKTALANPWHWWNWRHMVGAGGRTRTGNTGQERVVNISWIAIAVGVATAFWLFYQWVQSIVGRTLHRIGNNIVDTRLPGDDDDIQAPAGFKHKAAGANADSPPPPAGADDEWVDVEPKDHGPSIPGRFGGDVVDTDAKESKDESSKARSSGIDAARTQGWSFSGI